MLCKGVLYDQNSINSIDYIANTFNDNKTITKQKGFLYYSTVQKFIGRLLLTERQTRQL